jgi:hypothetical protein
MSALPEPKVLRTSLPFRTLTRRELEKVESAESISAVTPLGIYPETDRVTHFGLARGPVESILAWNPRTEYWEQVATLEWVAEDADWESTEPDPCDVTLRFCALESQSGDVKRFTPTTETPFEQLDEYLRFHVDTMYTSYSPPQLLFELFRALTE